ncbi:BMC domain-containing protein [Arachnia propionica]|uniref:BMC domain-containing protein n=1 Tax=Arachnia propionica TaxID=1750 RepID=A0A3P1X3I6_9ACTN|nr:BMC domain-containing protein [Arachnia propionica]RRD51333.1 BMC domain-containing protein [Arachnia propionica]
MAEWSDKQRIIQEFVPGKQVTLAHIIANPDPHLYPKIGLPSGTRGAIGVLTITPGEAAVIAADIATKSAGVELAFVDRFSGSLIVTGQVADVEAAVSGIVTTLQSVLSFTPAPITQT